MNTYTIEQQENYLFDMKKLVNKIRKSRDITGEDPKDHEYIWEQIGKLYDKLDRKYQEEFNNYVQ